MIRQRAAGAGRRRVVCEWLLSTARQAATGRLRAKTTRGPKLSVMQNAGIDALSTVARKHVGKLRHVERLRPIHPTHVCANGDIDIA
jgi:hypothetical protein